MVTPVRQVYTVGHSTHSIEGFISLLQRHEIEVVADVRSRPYSGRFPHFSRDSVQRSLGAAGIKYVFLGRELGARREESEVYVSGQAEYQRIAKLPAFAEGIDRLLTGLSKYRVAVMCAEQDPLTCHRTILVCHELKKYEVEIKHIERTGKLEDNDVAERRLIAEELGNLGQDDMFATRPDAPDLLERAYRKRAGLIAYREEDRVDDHSHDRLHSEVR